MLLRKRGRKHPKKRMLQKKIKIGKMCGAMRRSINNKEWKV